MCIRDSFRLEEEAIHCGKLRIFQWAPSMISADVLSENIDFPFELFIFAAVFIDLQLCLGGIFQILGQLAADVIGIELTFLVKVGIAEQCKNCLLYTSRCV